ncbi:osteoclast-associated immunoglobulin-like receptor [Carcharodon carcharias]|uniref:osteoclast-associated immunoglobulin-like receptor n=1 Tax=Carcharodon carcharias TaxID=13397 RepID=UPI001B7DFA24|nr:osteoclast-associated immunoglobulin-like receptor [Carcharodon carcharias]
MNSGGLFNFYRDGETRRTINVSGSVPSASFIVNDLISAGNWSFNCDYARTVKQTNYYSPRSETVQVIVTALPSIASPNLSPKTLTQPLSLSSVHRPKQNGQELSVMFDAETRFRKHYISFMPVIMASLPGTKELPRATISVEPPSGVVRSGRPIRLTCTGAILNSGGLFNFYRDGETRRTINVSGSVPSASFIVNDLISAGNWSFNCDYARTVKQTNYYSPRSETVQVIVTEELPRAAITVEPPSGVVRSGRPIRLTCTGAIMNSGGLFNFYRDGETRRTINVSGSVPSASFIVNDLISAGNWSFNCDYARTVKQTNYYSPRSETVQVIVTDFNGTSNSFQNRLGLVTFVLLGLCLSWE